MLAFQRIVVGIDLDPQTSTLKGGSFAAAETALWLVSAGEGQVTLVHSLARDQYFDPLVNELVSICGSVTPESRLAISALIANFRGHGAACETVDSSEPAPAAILHEVQQQHADMVLLGKHDGREVDASRIGPIALRVLRESTAPVWTVVPGRPIAPRTIVAATDLTFGGDAAVRNAAALTDFAHAQLHVVHVHPPALHTRPGSKAERELKTRAAMQRPLTPAQRQHAQLHIREGVPAQGVLSLVEELEPDLVVFGAFSHKRDPLGFVGSTAERLIGRLETALLVIKPN